MTGEKPRDVRVRTIGRCGEMRSSIPSRLSIGGRISWIGESTGISSMGSFSGRSVFDSSGISLLASSTIFPKVQVIAMPPTVSSDWKVGRPSPFFAASSSILSPPAVVMFPPGSTIRGIPIPSCSTFAIHAALKHCISRRERSTDGSHMPAATTLPSTTTSPSPPR